MANVILKSFPFDSMEKLNAESGKMEPDRLYEAEVFRKYFAKFLSNGVYFGTYKNYGENSMKVTSDGGLTIRVAKGAGLIEGADFENEEERIFALERPTSGNRIDRVVVRFDKTLATRETQLYIKRGTGTATTALQRDDNVYEICLAEVVVRSDANISQSDITDRRMSNGLCGIVNSLISVDGDTLYKKFQAYIDSVTNNLLRKDQSTITISGIFKDANGGTSKNNFTDTYKSKLDGIASGANKTTVENVLTSTSTSNALSAAQGKTLKGLIDTIKSKLDGIQAGANKTTVENVLTSTSTVNALSAAQGKVLKGLIDGKQKTITRGTANPSGGSSGDIYIQYF